MVGISSYCYLFSYRWTLSGIGLGVAGGFGLAILTLGFGLPVGEMPTSVVFIIMTVITCVSLLQGAGGLDYMISMAEKILRKKPSAITFLGPLVSYIFTVICGTSYVAFSVYPVIAEIAINAKVRPERAMSMSVIASNMAVCASPTSAIAAAMIAITAPIGVTPLSLLAVTVPACLIGVLVGCLFVYKRGAELADDPEFKRRVATGQFQEDYVLERDTQNATTSAKVSVVIFLLAIAIIVGMTSHPDLLPNIGPGGKPISVPTLLQIMMLATGAIIMVVCRVPRDKLDSGSVFKSGLIGAVGILGISWMTDTFFCYTFKIYYRCICSNIDTISYAFWCNVICYFYGIIQSSSNSCSFNANWCIFRITSRSINWSYSSNLCSIHHTRWCSN